MGEKVNLGIITGRVAISGHNYARIHFYGLIGDPSNGKIALYDDSGVEEPHCVSCDSDSDGSFVLSFGWNPAEIGKMLNTDLRGNISVSGITNTSETNTVQILGTVEIKFAVAVCLGNIQFNPVEEYCGKFASILMDFYLAIRKIGFHPILNNLIKMSPETLVVLGNPR